MKKLFLILLALGLAGCATTTRYFAYTNEVYPPKSKYYAVPVYLASQHLPAPQAYSVIGKVEVQGYASDGVTPDMLMEQARSVARKKGADAIINANTQAVSYNGTYVIPGHYRVRYGYYHTYYYYHPPAYVPYQNTLLEFTGDLVIYRTHR